MEASSVPSASAWMRVQSAARPRSSASRATPPWLACSYLQRRVRHAAPFSSSSFSFSSPSSSSSTSRAAVRACEKQPLLADEEDMAILQPSSEGESCTTSFLGSLTLEHKTLVALCLSLGFALGSAEAAMALGPEGPLVEEFWDNMRRYGLYFLTVFTGGLYSLLQPIFSLLRNPITAILTIAVLSGSFYLLFLLLSTMLGITSFDYKYA